MIHVQKLSKKFGLKTILNGIDYELSEGQCAVLMGPNGSGKTTLIRILASISSPSGGSVTIADCRLPGQAVKARKKLGVVLHQTMLYENLSAEENLKFFGNFYHLPDVERKVAEVIRMVGLYHRRKDIVRTFSRGMQQRMAIARAILHEPDVLLLDEPYTGLDETACGILEQVLRRFIDEKGTVMMSSHDVRLSSGLVDRIDVLSRGHIIASWKSEEIHGGDVLPYYQEALRRFEEDNERIRRGVS